MADYPLVTIGAINYNNSKYVIDTLNSIKAQTYPNIELVIVDDCSTDNGVQLIKDWLAAYDKPFKFIQHKNNLGITATSNTTLNNATGKYFNLIATDDVMMPDKIQCQVEILENSADDVCAVYSDAYLMKENGDLRYGRFIQMFRNLEELPSGNIYNILLEGNFLPAMAPLIRLKHLKIIGNYDPELKFEDYDIWLRLAKQFKFVFSDYVSVKYRMRNNSLTSNIGNWNPSFIKIYLKHFRDSPIALKQLLKYSSDAYRWNDKESLNLLKNSKIDSKYIKWILFLSKLPLNNRLGLKVIQRFLKEYY